MKQQRSADNLLGGVLFNVEKLIDKAKVEMEMLHSSADPSEKERIRMCLRSLDFVKTAVQFAYRSSV